MSQFADRVPERNSVLARFAERADNVLDSCENTGHVGLADMERLWLIARDACETGQKAWWLYGKAEARTVRLARELEEAVQPESLAEAERDELRVTVERVSMVKVWRNEDGKRFVFADDLMQALGWQVGEASDG